MRLEQKGGKSAISAVPLKLPRVHFCWPCSAFSLVFLALVLCVIYYLCNVVYTPTLDPGLLTATP